MGEEHISEPVDVGRGTSSQSGGTDADTAGASADSSLWLLAIIVCVGAAAVLVLMTSQTGRPGPGGTVKRVGAGEGAGDPRSGL